jgi:hypothetical protein
MGAGRIKMDSGQFRASSQVSSTFVESITIVQYIAGRHLPSKTNPAENYGMFKNDIEIHEPIIFVMLELWEPIIS